MSRIVVVSGSPASASRSLSVCQRMSVSLRDAGFIAEVLDVRDIPAEDLLRWPGDSLAVRAAANKIEQADGVVLVTPVYKVAYSGVLKAFLDVLPQLAFAEKVVLPVCIAGSPAHLLAIDYALRPVLASMGHPHVLRGMFLLETSLPRGSAGPVDFDGETAHRVESAIDDLVRALDYPSRSVIRRVASSVGGRPS